MRISDWSSDVCSSDLQISGNILNDKLTFIAGAFYLKDKPWGDNYLVVDLYRPPVVPYSTLNAEETYSSASSFALLGPIGYDLGSLIDGLTFNAGLRYTWDDFTAFSTTCPYRAPSIGYDVFLSAPGLGGKTGR